MNYLKQLSIIVLWALLGASVAACDEVDAADRFVELPPVELQRVVLLEEYTGQKCQNCPVAHEVISSLQEQYPDNFIAVSIHAGGDDNSIGEGQFSNRVGLRTDEGETLAAQAGVAAYPMGRVNRHGSVSGQLTWAGLVRAEVASPSSLHIDLKASGDDDNITIDLDLVPGDNIDGDLMLWIVEDGIVAQQMLPSGTTNRAYVHNNVFRGTVNGVNGEPLRLTTREPVSLQRTIAKKAHWTLDNLSVVAFVTDAGGVVQAAKVKVTPAE